MKLIIENIRLCNNQYTNITKFSSYLKERLNLGHIKYEIITTKNSITFKEVEKKLFRSSRTNFIKLKEGDSRIEKNKRNYLESERLTKQQFEHVIKVFTNHIDQIGISCDIKIFPDAENANKVIEIRKDLCNYVNNWPKPESFPLERI